MCVRLTPAHGENGEVPLNSRLTRPLSGRVNAAAPVPGLAGENQVPRADLLHGLRKLLESRARGVGDWSASRVTLFE